MDMGSGRRLQKDKGSIPSTVPTTRNLEKAQLGGVIFGCTKSTMKECLVKQLFGLPANHYLYVKNIEPGLPLFLFDYSKRELHGIFEAASSGQLNINPYGWTVDGSERTSYPAQVQIRIRKSCHPVLENQFAPIIEENYFTPKHFWFELDYAQVSKLISLFSTQVVAPCSPVLKNTGKWQMKTQHRPGLEIRKDEGVNTVIADNDSTACYQLNEHLCLNGIHQPLGADKEVIQNDEKEPIDEKLLRLNLNGENSNNMLSEGDGSRKEEMAQHNNIKDSILSRSDFQSIIAQLMNEVEDLKAFKQEHIQKMGQLEEKLIKSEMEVQWLKDHCMMLESLSNHSEAHRYETMTESCSEQHLDPEDIIFLAGGYDGKSWLSSLDSYYPSKDVIKSLRPMSLVRSYASVAKLNGDLYVIGGGNGSLWYDTVDSYNPVNNDWRPLPCLNEKKGSLAAATLHDKIFAMGGGNGVDCFSYVEMFDLDVGRWIPAKSMLQKRFALAAVELNGALYAVGGFDGKDYLSSAERFDPREHHWSRLESMDSKRGCHSLVVLNEKLYAIGGFDGSTMVATVEVFDPRHGKWMTEAPMKHSRGYATAVVLRDNIYAIGGVEDDQNIVAKVERYEEGHGWQLTNLKAVGKRCFASAIVL